MENRRRVAGRNSQACRRRRSRLEMTVGWDVWATLMQVAVVGGQQTVRVGQRNFPSLGAVWELVGISISSPVGFLVLGGIVGLLLSSRRGGFRVAGWVGWRTTTGQQQQDRLFRNTYGRVAWERLVVVVFRTAVRATFGRRDGTGGQSSRRERRGRLGY